MVYQPSKLGTIGLHFHLCERKPKRELEILENILHQCFTEQWDLLPVAPLPLPDNKVTHAQSRASLKAGLED